ncbi:potassium transporter Kup [Ahniella affigens]|uniref:Probable potassium transport system protein Kup n=1 Tax=Ahniella affigens TaxID=2021234 RepID=A0A2P1PMU6_9GAMM|nr:potassium transporter Kup [Ahniella affigens]AVP96159.1 potassium transporter Kup [Ahniella affigens]
MANAHTEQKGAALLATAVAAIGVVFGDIGTSPLYTMKESFSGSHGMPISETNVLGILSLATWALILVVSIKYVIFIMRANNRGEGGIMAMMALALQSVGENRNLRRVIVTLAIFGAALFYGDGVITPAMSILGAVEGMKVIAPEFERYIVPATIVIVLGLFAMQRSGTAGVGRVFGPIMTIWFLVIGVLGLVEILVAPTILRAVNPWYGVLFFLAHPLISFVALGTVVLAITGAEAVYADMGHFGMKPIRIAWFVWVFPGLLLNYYGQGALLLNDPTAAANPFYLLAPDWARIPLLILATCAAVIASQAVISGAFSVTRQAIQLGFAPRMRVLHTSDETAGQIFVPWVNRFLLIAIILTVIGFQNSTNLAAAYGIAVTGAMLIDTLLALIVAVNLWRWSKPLAILAGFVFISIDLGFFLANAIKIPHGGWYPLVLGALVFLFMTTWRKGRVLIGAKMKAEGLSLAPFISSIAAHPPLRVPGSAVFMTTSLDSVPHALLHNLKHNKVLHDRNVLLTVEVQEIPVVDKGDRLIIEALGNEFYSIKLRFGFAEDPNVPRVLESCEACGLPFDMMDTTFFLSRETLVPTADKGMPLWRDKIFAFMHRNAEPATAYFQIPGNRLIELGTQVDI